MSTHKELKAWQKAVEDSRTTIQYLEQRGKEKTKIIRELQHENMQLQAQNYTLKRKGHQPS